MTWHVYPTADLIEHETSDDCPCGPRQEAVTRPDGSVGFIAVHHSLDGRECLHGDEHAPEETA